MIVALLLLLLVSLLLNAFFSGSETGFFRATRLRLVIDALAGDRISRGLLWLVNRPSLFVATGLVGNNLANYGISLAVVMLSQMVFPTGSLVVEIVIPIAVAPLVFVLGDLLPKNLFYDAPNRLLRLCAPLFMVFTWIFIPITLLLWAFGRLLQLLTRTSPQQVRLSLARQELTKLMTEGQEAGILRPVQQTLAQAMLSVASQPVKNFALREGRVVRVTTTMSKSEVLRIAQRNRRTLLPVEDTAAGRRLVGYVRTVDLYLGDSPSLPAPEPLVPLQAEESFLSALRKMNQAEDALGHVVSREGKTVGFVTGRELRTALLRQGVK